MLKLTITIENLSEGKKRGYAAVIKELGNSVIMADSIDEIFKLLPDLIESMGIKKKSKIKNTAVLQNALHPHMAR